MTCPLSCSGAVETKVTARELHTALRAYSDLHVSCCDAIAKAYLNHTLAVEARVAAAAAAAAASGDAVDEQAGGVVGRLPSIGTLVQVRAGGPGCAPRRHACWAICCACLDSCPCRLCIWRTRPSDSVECWSVRVVRKRRDHSVVLVVQSCHRTRPRCLCYFLSPRQSWGHPLLHRVCSLVHRVILPCYRRTGEVPFVTMILRTSDADGRVSGHPLQMSLAEFRVRLFTVGGAVPSATVPVCRDSWGGLSRCFDVALWVLQTFADSLREAAACMDKM